MGSSDFVPSVDPVERQGNTLPTVDGSLDSRFHEGSSSNPDLISDPDCPEYSSSDR